MTTTTETTARLTSRKFILAMTVFIGASLLLAFKMIEPAVWRDIVIAVLGGYLTSNVVQKAVTAKVTTP